MIFEPLVLRYGDPQSFTVSPVMIIADPLITVLISTPVQFFIAWRIKIISGSMLMPLVIVFFGTCAFIGGVSLTVSVTFIREWARFKQFEGAVITWLASSAAADLFITVALSWSLFRRKTGIKTTDDKIAKIIRLTVQTGLVTAVFALADVLIFLSVPHTTLNFIWDLALSKLYTNSLLSTLNARAGWDNLNGKNGDEDSNILFGRTQRSAASSGRRHGTNNTMSGIIELEDTTLGSDHRVKLGTLEDGVAVHTVVERLSDEAYRQSYRGTDQKV